MVNRVPQACGLYVLALQSPYLLLTSLANSSQVARHWRGRRSEGRPHTWKANNPHQAPLHETKVRPENRSKQDLQNKRKKCSSTAQNCQKPITGDTRFFACLKLQKNWWLGLQRSTNQRRVSSNCFWIWSNVSLAFWPLWRARNSFGRKTRRLSHISRKQTVRN